MIKSRIAAGAALLALAGAAHAGSFSVTPAVTNDYDWRGWTQTDEDFAFQLGASYTFDSGFYVGTWGSNVDFGPGDPDMEVDIFAGYGGSTGTFDYDLGVNYYSYPGDSDGNFFEIYAGISSGWFAGKLWYSPKFLGDYGDDSGFYAEANGTFPLVGDLSVIAHLGYSFGSVWDDEVLDYSAGLSYSFANFDLSAKYVDKDVSGEDGRFVAMISTTLPWMSE